MKLNINKLLLLTVSCSLLTVMSCTRVDLEDPLKGKITLTTDWSKRTTSIEQPTDYTVTINNQTLIFHNNSNILPELIAGTYPIWIYNTPEKVTVSGTSATVTTTGNVVEPLPGWLFTAVAEAVYVDFKEETITTTMQQQTRQLTIELTVTEGDPERIASTVTTLTGIANSFDFKTNKYSGTDLSVSPLFTRNGNKLTANVCLLGMVGNSQVLTFNINFTDGSTQQIESNVSSFLTNFNTDKHMPKYLSATLSLPVEAGFGATIAGWKTTNSSGGVAN